MSYRIMNTATGDIVGGWFDTREEAEDYVESKQEEGECCGLEVFEDQ